MALEKAGVELVAEGASAFIGDMEKVDKAVESFAESATKATKAADLWQDAQGRWRTSSGRFASDAEKAAAGVESLVPAAKGAGDAAKQAGNDAEKGGHGFSAFGEMAIGALRHIGEIAVDALGKAAQATGQFLKESVTSAGDFQQGMSVLQAVTGSTDDQMAALQKTAIALGNDVALPASSAQDAATAMQELAKAGLSVDDTMASARATLLLATAAETDAGTAASIVAGALNAFHLEGSEAAKVADQLSAGANASASSITDLSQGFQAAGFAFSTSGQQTDDLIASLSLLTNVGLTGSDAGTALKNAMLQLMAPTDAAAGVMADYGINVRDAQGNMLPFRDIIGVLQEKLGGLNAEQRDAALKTLLQSDGMKAMIPLLDAGVAGFDAMKASVNEAGAAQSVAGAQTDGFNGAIGAVTNALDTMKLTIGMALLPILTTLLNDYITPGIGIVSEFVNSILSADDPLAAITGLIDGIIPGFSTFVTWVETGVSALFGLDQKSNDIVNALAAFGGATDTVSESSSAFGGVLDDLSGIWEQMIEVVTNVGDAYMEIMDAVLPIVQQFIEEHGDEISAFFKATYDTIIQIIHTALDLYNAIVPPILRAIAGFISAHGDEIVGILTNVWGIISHVIDAALTLIQGMLKTALQLINGDFDGAWQTIQEMSARFVADLIAIIGNAAEGLASAAQLGLDAILNVWHSFTDWAGIGGSIIDGIVSGVVAGARDLARAAADAAHAALEAAKDAIGFGSPAKKFMPLGAAMVEGMEVGAERMAGQLSAAIGQIAYSPAIAAVPSAAQMFSSSSYARTTNLTVDARGSSLSMADIQRGVQAGLRAEGMQADILVRTGAV